MGAHAGPRLGPCLQQLTQSDLNLASRFLPKQAIVQISMNQGI